MEPVYGQTGLSFKSFNEDVFEFFLNGISLLANKIPEFLVKTFAFKNKA